MRSIIFISIVFAAACSTATPRPQTATNAQLRFEIARAIARDSAGQQPRRITRVGEVTADSAIVYTAPNTASGAGQEERWVRADDGWKLAGSKPISVADGRN